MATNQNVIAITGRITQPPEMRYTQGGTSVLTVNIANNRSYKTDGSDDWKTEVCFIECTVWGKYAESLAERLQKGFLVNVSGRLKQNTWEDQNENKRSKHTITVANLEVVNKPSGNSESSESSESQQQENNYQPPQSESGNPFSDDTIPF